MDSEAKFPALETKPANSIRRVSGEVGMRQLSEVGHLQQELLNYVTCYKTIAKPLTRPNIIK